ncbi:hypothetical protein [Pseudophaeobacter leonis]|uniref:hypothetical protein n=1 Tax=Pseudophaeobacter leonis TaxID=1144477 RepID=UPI0009F6E630|nr:hypothetical protein [Pseudophaeobacter leonis]
MVRLAPVAADIADLHPVATSGSYNDLTDTPVASERGGGAQFAQFEVNPAGELILFFYAPAGAVGAEDFSISADGELLLEIGL